MNRQRIIDAVLGKRILKLIYYKLKRNKMDRSILLESEARLIHCIIKQERGCVGNAVKLCRGVTMKECSIEFHGNNNTVVIGAHTQMINDQIIIYDDFNKLCIGERVNVDHSTKFILLEGKNITVGDDCLLSYNIEIRNSDSHSLLDCLERRINFAKSVNVGSHVWIGQRALILKGATVGNNCVVAAGSIVTEHYFSDKSLILGIPARVHRENINWDINRI